MASRSRINDGGYVTGLASLGQLATTKLNLILDYTLAHTGVDPSTLKAHVDGTSVGMMYDPSGNDIHLVSGGTALSVVDINYCLKQVVPAPTPSPSPSSSPTPVPTPTPTPTFIPPVSWSKRRPSAKTFRARDGYGSPSRARVIFGGAWRRVEARQYTRHVYCPSRGACHDCFFQFSGSARPWLPSPLARPSPGVCLRSIKSWRASRPIPSARWMPS